MWDTEDCVVIYFKCYGLLLPFFWAIFSNMLSLRFCCSHLLVISEAQ